MNTWWRALLIGLLVVLIGGWGVMKLWAAPVSGNADPAASQAIQQAPDPSAVVGAFANGFAVKPNNPQLYAAYVSRTVDLGLPEMAYHQARTLTTLDSRIGWDVIACVDARRANKAHANLAINWRASSHRTTSSCKAAALSVVDSLATVFMAGLSMEAFMEEALAANGLPHLMWPRALDRARSKRTPSGENGRGNLDRQLRLQARLDGELLETEPNPVAEEFAAGAEAELLLIKYILAGYEFERAVPEDRRTYWSKIERAINRRYPG